MSSPRLSLVVLAAACLCVTGRLAAAAAEAAPALPLRVAYRGTLILPDTVPGADNTPIRVTGLSGVTWLGESRYAAIMDNSNALILFSLALSPTGEPVKLTDLRAVTLSESHDYEDIATCPDALLQRIADRRRRQGLDAPGRTLLVSEENTPAIRAVSLDTGNLLGVVPIPEQLLKCRLNRGLEALTVDLTGGQIWTANEEALPADGPPATMTAGTTVRLVRISVPGHDPAAREESRQFAYAVEPPHQFIRVFDGEPLSGVSALVSLGDERLLVFERSGCPGLPPFKNRIYLVDTRTATDVSGVEKDLAEQTAVHVPKILLWQDQLGCNLEGLCLGPVVSGGGRVLVAVADNGGLGLPSQIVTFVLDDPSGAFGLPAIAAIALAAGLVPVVLLSRWIPGLQAVLRKLNPVSDLG